MEPHGAVSPAAGVSGDVALEGHGAGGRHPQAGQGDVDDADHVVLHVLPVQRARRQRETLAHPSAGDRAGLCRSRSAARRHDHGHHPQTAQRQAPLEDSLADALHPQGTRAATGLARLSQAARSATVSSRTLGQVGDQRGAANHLLSRADDPGQGSTGARRDSGATHAGLRTALRNDPGEPQQAVRPD